MPVTPAAWLTRGPRRRFAVIAVPSATATADVAAVLAGADGSRTATTGADPVDLLRRSPARLPSTAVRLASRVAVLVGTPFRPTDPDAPLEETGDLLPDAPVLPEPDAALCRATAKVLGVSVVADAKDCTGGSGIGPGSGERDGRTVRGFDKNALGFPGSPDTALPDVGVTDHAGGASAT